MEQGRTRDKAVVRSNAELRRKDQRAHDHGAMGNDSALRQSGGAARVEDDEAIFRLRLDRKRVVGLPRKLGLIWRADFQHWYDHRGKTRRQVRFDDQQLRRDKLDAISELAAG